QRVCPRRTIKSSNQRTALRHIETNLLDWSCSDESPARHSLIFRGLIPVLYAGSARASHDESTEEAIEFATQQGKEKELCKTGDSVVALLRVGNASLIKILTVKWKMMLLAKSSLTIYIYSDPTAAEPCDIELEDKAREVAQLKTERSHSSSVYLEIKLTEEVARDKQSCFFFRKQVRLQETLTPKKLLILALQEAERNGNSIYIICLIRVENSEDEDHTSQVEVLYSSIVRLPKFNLSPSGHSTLGQLAFSYMPVKFKFLRARACTRTSPLNLAIEILKWSEERTNICVMYTLCPVLIKFFTNQCIHIKNKSNVNSHHYLE
ncbi:unnamed protein product, partial [Brassica rapa subsp. trilocularis]